MEEGYEMEEFADQSIEAVQEFINLEGRLVKEKHALDMVIQHCGNMLFHLDERIPEHMSHLHDLNGEVTDKLVEIQTLLESGELEGLEIVSQEKEALEKLEKDGAHIKFKAIKEEVDKEEKSFIDLNIGELKNLHSRFLELTKLMEKDNIVKAINQDLANQKEKEEYEELEEYYFLQIYKVLKAYEKIFGDLLRQEHQLKFN
ncbi:MAG: hypothetical protein CMH64_02355 [Nanoarchaeota archaeon]|nr:hypothetical protein [Nanoarchaeota archaeon]|tara:strand:- start:1424 stop:2029 length:606 start_codon:yes stop_codon:yes gene_type:complete